MIEDEAAVHLVEELASGGELFDRIIEHGSVSEKDAVNLIHQVQMSVHFQSCSMHFALKKLRTPPHNLSAVK